jgi:hypothetical protein
MAAAPDFTHVIMTRFNLATPGRESDIRNRPGWLAGRFDLFERYCLPTLAAQTVQDFEWVIYFDEGTPAEFRERIERCRAVRPFTPYYTPLFPADGWPRSLRETLPAPRPWLLTTRLDNDDGLAVDFVARLHAAVRTAGAPERGSFNFTNGFIMEGPRLYALAHPSNAFGSWLEPWDDAMRTAPSIHHMHMAEHGPVTQIDGPGAWLQVVHGGNVSNRVRGRRVGLREAQGRFPPAPIAQLRPAGRAEMLLENLALAPLRANRDRAASLARKVLNRALGTNDVK